MKMFMKTGCSDKIKHEPLVPRQADFQQANSTSV